VDEAEKEIEHHIGKNDELVIRNDRYQVAPRIHSLRRHSPV
jgi:hypothetical protein